MIAVAAFVLASHLRAAVTSDDFSTDPDIGTGWTEYSYLGSENVTPTWNGTDQDLDLAGGGGSVLGLYRTGSSRSPTDPVRLTIKDATATGGTWGQVGLMITGATQPDLLDSNPRYELELRWNGGTSWYYLVRKDVGTDSYDLYSSSPFTFSGPITLEIERNGDDYDFKANGSTLYTASSYTPTVHDTLVNYQITLGGDSTMTATVDDFGVGGGGSDTTPPMLASLSPADDAPDVPVSSDLVVSFNEGVAYGTGDITLRTSGGGLVEAFDVTTSPNLSVSGATVTIDPTSDLTAATGYYVEIDSTAIKDGAGNFFAGISDDTTWNFTTATTATGTVVDFSTDPNLATEWTEYGYFPPDNTTPTWNSADEDLDLSKPAGNNGPGLYLTGSLRAPTDTVTLTVKELERTGGTWGFLGLMLSAVEQPGYVTTADDTYTFAVVAEGGTNVHYEVRRTYLDGTSDFTLYSGASFNLAASGPIDLKIARNGDGNYAFLADGVLLYTSGDAPGDFYDAVARDSLVNYQIVLAGDSAIDTTVDNFGAYPPETIPPTLAGSDIVDDQGGGTVEEHTLVTYTVTFSEDMNAATVSAADFGNAGTSTVTIGTVAEAAPGVFTVPVSPGSVGTLQLQVDAGAVLKDVAGNLLDTAVAIADDTTITVIADTTAPTLTGIADNQGGGPIEVHAPVTYTVTFSEDMDAATVSAADFGTIGTATATIGTVTETAPYSGVFTVPVTPIGAGTLQLQVPAGAVLLDLAGFGVDTTSAIVDDAIINVIPDTTAPTLAGADIADDMGGGPVDMNVPVNYTVTFSEDMDAATVSVGDFGNAGTARIAIGTVNETAPSSGVFTMPVTPTSTGTIQLRVNAGANLQDLSGHPVDTASDISDDTTLNITVPTVNWQSMMTIAPRQYDGLGNLLPLQSYDETIQRGISFLLDDHLTWFKGPPTTLLDEEGNTQMPWAHYSNLQQDGTPFPNSVDRFVSYPAFHHSLLIQTFLGYWDYDGDVRALDEAIVLADWNIAHSTPDDWAYGNLPYSTFQEQQPGGFRDGPGLMPDKAAIMGLTYLELFDVTGESRFLAAAEAIGHTLSQRQRANGTWPFRVHPQTEAVIEEYTSSVIYAVMLFEELDERNGNQIYESNRDLTLAWLLNGPVQTKDFRGFYEDIGVNTSNRTNWDCIDTVSYLLANRTDTNGYLAIAVDLNTWIENTFMDLIPGFEPAEGIREQLVVNVVMGIHSLHWASMLYNLGGATGDESMRERASQTANYITYYLQPDNRIPVGFTYNQWWYSTHTGVVLYLFDFVGPGTFGGWISGFEVGGLTGFEDDFDQDGLGNGLEAWFGTDPGEFNPGLAGLTTDGTTTTFTHPQNANPPSDLTGFYQWSPNLQDWYAGDGIEGPGDGPTVGIFPNTGGTTTTVTVTASETMGRIFLRAGVMQN